MYNIIWQLLCKLKMGRSSYFNFVLKNVTQYSQKVDVHKA